MEKLKINLTGPSEQSYNPELLAKMKADTLNGTPGTLDGTDCPKCLNKGFIAYPRQDGTVYTVECSCMSMRRCCRELDRSGLKNSIRELTFERYDANYDWQKTIKAGAERYARDPKGWLLFCGQSGCGKTHLCTAVCREQLLSGKEVLYMPWRDRSAEIKAMSLDSDARETLLSALKNAPFLYIDDLFKTASTPDGTTSPTAADVNLAFELLNFRGSNRLPTVISTELMPRELVAIDESTGSRILDMADTHIYAIARDPKKNFRLRNVINL